jgi:hypothetical protein
VETGGSRRNGFMLLSGWEMGRNLTRRTFVGICNVLGLATAAASVGAAPGWAAALPKPEGKVILTISGRIANTNNGNSAEFDMPMIEAIGIESFTTKTPWYKDPVTFSGVPMARLLAFVGATGSSLSVTALNDYATEIPVEDFKTLPVMLATKRDGAYMPVRDKGPLFIVYNYDSNPDLQHQRFYSRSAWQVARMVVK